MDPYVRIQQALNLGMVDGVRERAREIDRPLAIAAVRTAFETFGDALITYAKERHAPYYGQTMSDCGRFVTDLPTVSQPPGSGTAARSQQGQQGRSQAKADKPAR
jgi:hypothetical protein